MLLGRNFDLLDGYLVVTARCLVVTTAYCLLPGGCWWLLLLAGSFFFLNCYLAVPRPTLGHSQVDSFTKPMLINAFVHIRPEGHWQPRNEVGYVSPVECLAGFEAGTFRFLLQSLNPVGHSP